MWKGKLMAISAVSKDFVVKHGLVVTTTATFLSNVEAYSTNTGALIVSGGIGAGGSVHASNLYATNNGKLGLYDANNSNYVGFKSIATLTRSTIYTLPDVDGGYGQVLTTDGNANLNWSTPASGGPGGSGYPPFPTGDYGLGEDYPTDGILTDAFGVSLEVNFDCMAPSGALITTDLGLLV